MAGQTDGLKVGNEENERISSKKTKTKKLDAWRFPGGKSLEAWVLGIPVSKADSPIYGMKKYKL